MVRRHLGTMVCVGIVLLGRCQWHCSGESDMMPRIEECCGTARGDLDAGVGVYWYTVLLGGCDGTALDKVPRYNVWKPRRHGHGVNGSYTDQRFSVTSILEESTLP